MPGFGAGRGPNHTAHRVGGDGRKRPRGNLAGYRALNGVAVDPFHPTEAGGKMGATSRAGTRRLALRWSRNGRGLGLALQARPVWNPQNSHHSCVFCTWTRIPWGWLSVFVTRLTKIYVISNKSCFESHLLILSLIIYYLWIQLFVQIQSKMYVFRYSNSVVGWKFLNVLRISMKMVFRILKKGHAEMSLFLYIHGISKRWKSRRTFFYFFDSFYRDSWNIPTVNTTRPALDWPLRACRNWPEELSRECKTFAPLQVSADYHREHVDVPCSQSKILLPNVCNHSVSISFSLSCIHFFPRFSGVKNGIQTYRHTFFFLDNVRIQSFRNNSV